MNGEHNWTGAVLAGGKSTRMGMDKAFIQLDGKSLIDRSLDLLDLISQEQMIIGDPEKYGHLLPNTLADVRPHSGPLGGVLSVLQFASYDKCAVVACDMPGLTSDLFEFLKPFLRDGIDAVIPTHGGMIEPLAALYHRRCAPVFRTCIENTVFKMSDALACLACF